MSDYIIINGELYHHGVKGMKWGVRKKTRLEKRASKKLTKAGIRYGQAEYERATGNDVYKRYKREASTFDKKAKALESEGKYFRARAFTRTAEKIRDKGKRLKDERDSYANWYEKDGDALKQKANKFITKKKVDIGKNKVRSIINSGKDIGWDKNKTSDERERAKKQEAARENVTAATLELINYLRNQS